MGVDHKDVELYRQNEKKNRRKSLQMRLQSHKEYKLKQLKKEQQAAIQREEDQRMRQQDREELEKYQLALQENTLKEMLASMSWR